MINLNIIRFFRIHIHIYNPHSESYMHLHVTYVVMVNHMYIKICILKPYIRYTSYIQWSCRIQIELIKLGSYMIPTREVI
jgi:hypothetical protein